MSLKKKSLGTKIFDAANYSILFIITLVCVLPFIYVIAGSFAAPELLVGGEFILFPTKFSITSYKYIFSTSTLMRSMGVSIYITIFGTLINMLLTTITAYPLSQRQLKGRSAFLFIVIFTMLFNGGMIPTFLVVRQVGLLDSLWALMLPTAINAFNLIIMKNFFQSVPVEMIEAAKIDGYHDLYIFFRIMLPLSKAALATLTLFYAVYNWNTYFYAMLYINDSKKWPVQILLRQMVILAQGGIGNSDVIDPEVVIPTEGVKMATVVVATLPILLVYPFLQKHFVKGVMLGSVKG